MWRTPWKLESCDHSPEWGEGYTHSEIDATNMYSKYDIGPNALFLLVSVCLLKLFVG